MRKRWWKAWEKGAGVEEPGGKARHLHCMTALQQAGACRNEIPAMLGNLVGGLTFVGLMIYGTPAKTAPELRFAAKVRV